MVLNDNSYNKYDSVTKIYTDIISDAKVLNTTDDHFPTGITFNKNIIHKTTTEGVQITTNDISSEIYASTADTSIESTDYDQTEKNNFITIDSPKYEVNTNQDVLNTDTEKYYTKDVTTFEPMYNTEVNPTDFTTKNNYDDITLKINQEKEFQTTFVDKELVPSSSTIHTESTVRPQLKRTETSGAQKQVHENKNTKTPENQRNLHKNYTDDSITSVVNSTPKFQTTVSLMEEHTVKDLNQFLNDSETDNIGETVSLETINITHTIFNNINTTETNIETDLFKESSDVLFIETTTTKKNIKENVSIDIITSDLITKSTNVLETNTEKILNNVDITTNSLNTISLTQKNFKNESGKVNIFEKAEETTTVSSGVLSTSDSTQTATYSNDISTTLNDFFKTRSVDDVYGHTIMDSTRTTVKNEDAKDISKPVDLEQESTTYKTEIYREPYAPEEDQQHTSTSVSLNTVTDDRKLIENKNTNLNIFSKTTETVSSSETVLTTEHSEITDSNDGSENFFESYETTTQLPFTTLSIENTEKIKTTLSTNTEKSLFTNAFTINGIDEFVTNNINSIYTTDFHSNTINKYNGNKDSLKESSKTYATDKETTLSETYPVKTITESSMTDFGTGTFLTTDRNIVTEYTDITSKPLSPDYVTEQNTASSQNISHILQHSTRSEKNKTYQNESTENMTPELSTTVTEDSRLYISNSEYEMFKTIETTTVKAQDTSQKNVQIESSTNIYIEMTPDYTKDFISNNFDDEMTKQNFNVKTTAVPSHSQHYFKSSTFKMPLTNIYETLPTSETFTTLFNPNKEVIEELSNTQTPTTVTQSDDYNQLADKTQVAKEFEVKIYNKELPKTQKDTIMTSSEKSLDIGTSTQNLNTHTFSAVDSDINTTDFSESQIGKSAFIGKFVNDTTELTLNNNVHEVKKSTLEEINTLSTTMRTRFTISNDSESFGSSNLLPLDDISITSSNERTLTTSITNQTDIPSEKYDITTSSAMSENIYISKTSTSIAQTNNYIDQITTNSDSSDGIYMTVTESTNNINSFYNSQVLNKNTLTSVPIKKIYTTSSSSMTLENEFSTQKDRYNIDSTLSNTEVTTEPIELVNIDKSSENEWLLTSTNEPAFFDAVSTTLNPYEEAKSFKKENISISQSTDRDVTSITENTSEYMFRTQTEFISHQFHEKQYPSTISALSSTSLENLSSRRKDIDISAWTDSTPYLELTTTETSTDIQVSIQCKSNNHCPIDKFCYLEVCEDPCEVRKPCSKNVSCKVVNHAAVCACDDTAEHFCGKGMIEMTSETYFYFC